MKWRSSEWIHKTLSFALFNTIPTLNATAAERHNRSDFRKRTSEMDKYEIANKM